MNNCGFDEETAKSIERNYHDLYIQSDLWVKKHINFAKEHGYVTGAFGLRVRSPALKNALGRLTPMQAGQARTIGNALGQGWGLLNNRAMHAVLQEVDKAGHSNDVYPVAAIHDACYYMIRNDANIICWFNKIVVKESKWQEHPIIAHDVVGLYGELDVFYPDWSSSFTLPENVEPSELVQIAKQHKEKLKE